MSDIKAPGFKSSQLISALHDAFQKFSPAEKADLIKKANGIFELQVSNDAKDTVTWSIDAKKTGTVFKGKAQPKSDVTIILSDDTLVELSNGKLSGQKAFMTGRLKTRGNMMLATKLDQILKTAKAKL